MAIALLKRSARPVPGELRSNFHHLYLDIAWYGLLNGTAIAFAAVYATRLGANALQIGLITAGPAVVNLLLTLPAGHWLAGRRTQPAVFWGAVLHRVFYLPWIFLPILLAPHLQVWALVGLILLMSAPGTVLAIAFNAMFAEVVPVDWRSHVAGIRNALLAITFTASTVVAGALLDRLPFPTGYQVVFALGVVGAAMSTVHLALLRPVAQAAGDGMAKRNGQVGQEVDDFRRVDLAGPGRVRPPAAGLRGSVGLRYLIGSRIGGLLRIEVLRGSYGRLMVLLFGFHLAQFLPVSLFPLVMVNDLGLTDGDISLGTALFYLAVLASSLQLARLNRRFGNQRLAAAGAVGLTAYPLLMAFAQGRTLYLAASIIGGLTWALVGGTLANYLLERIPEDDRPAHLAWYNLSLNAAILLGSLGGALMGDVLGMASALILIAAMRLLSGLAIWRWG